MNLSKEKKKTIFLSSHILYEVELVANRMIIISKGSARIEGKVQDLLNANNLDVTFEVDNIESAKDKIQISKWMEKLNSITNNKIVFSLNQHEIAPLNKYLVENNIMVSAVVPKRSLEEYFLQITEQEGS